jgi:hypothetical protein
MGVDKPFLSASKQQRPLTVTHAMAESNIVFKISMVTESAIEFLYSVFHFDSVSQ